MEGQCLCGAVKVKVNDDNLFGSQRRGHLCHCSQCRKVAGGLFGANLTIETEKVEISGEENLTKYDDPETLSGTPISRYFCKTCGAWVEPFLTMLALIWLFSYRPIKSVTPNYKGKTTLKLGIYPRVPVPEWESFAIRRQTWEKPVEGCVQYKTKSMGEKL
jgi:hypothetical protein